MSTVASSGRIWSMDLPPGKLGRKGDGTPYEHKLLRDIAAEKPTGSAFDIGAYYGNHSLFLALVCGLSVHAFEPDPDRLAYLRRNVALSRADVTVHPWACGVGGTAHWEVAKSRTLRPGRGPVQVHAIDQRMHIHDLAVVKLDIEGMEALALRGMRRHLERCRPLVYSETHNDGADQAVVLEPLGYRHEATILAPAPMWKWRWRP